MRTHPNNPFSASIDSEAAEVSNNPIANNRFVPMVIMNVAWILETLFITTEVAKMRHAPQAPPVKVMKSVFAEAG